MAEVTHEPMYETPRANRDEVRGLREWRRDIQEEMVAMRMHQHAARGELNAPVSRMGSVEVQVDEIKQRLELTSEPAE